MKIIWRDENLEAHEIDLSHAVDVKVNGISIALSDNNGLKINTSDFIKIRPVVANTIIVNNEERY